MIGHTVGHYRILERLGEGGMGEVYLAEDLKLKRKAAIKFVAEHLTRDEARRERFVQEATLAASVDHPHVAAIYDIDQAGDRTFIAMEYVRGETLRGLLKHGPPPLRRVLDYSIQIADALAKVHQTGVTHRDLKPENVIVSEDGYVKVIDFGLAKLTEPFGGASDARTATDLQIRTADGLVLGTVAYMSPEQARGTHVDARSDVFSFGVLLHELLTGIAPFRRASTAETLSAILTETPSPPAIADPAVSPELQRIVRKCLVKDAGDRYQSMREVVIDLRGVRDALSTGAHSAAIDAVAPARKSRPLVWAAAAGVVFMLAVAGWLWRRNTTSGSGGATTTRPAIAVMSFDNVSGSADMAWLSAGLPSMLVTGLAQNPEIEVVTPDRLNEAARQVGQSLFSAVDPAARLDVVRRAGATIVVNGTIIRAGDGLRIDARVEDLATGRVVLADNVRGADPLALADDLAARIRRGLNVRPEAAVKPVAQLTSGSVEAYRLFALGIEAAINVRTADARKFFTEAVQVDPDFALAHLGLYRNGSLPFEERLKHLEQAARHLDRLSERDALTVGAAVAENSEKWKEALEKYQRLIARYPDFGEGYAGATVLYRYWLRDPARGTATIEQGVRALPAGGPLYNQLGYAYLGEGRTDDAIRAFEMYVKLRPNEPNALDSLAEGHLASGDLQRALDTAHRARTAGHPGSNTTVGWVLATMGRYDEALAILPERGTGRTFALVKLGRYREAETAIREGLIGFGGAQPDDRVAIEEFIRASLALDRGDCREALARSAKAGRMAENPAGRFAGVMIRGVCLARTNQLAAARAELERHHAELSAPELEVRWWMHVLEGEIALAAGDPARAAETFQAGEPPRKMAFNRSGPPATLTMLSNSLVLRDGLARARAAQGRFDEAIAIYRRLLVTDRQSKFTPFYEPRFVLALARLLEKTGRKDEARAEYRRFLELWKNADPGQPEVAEAKARAGSG